MSSIDVVLEESEELCGEAIEGQDSILEAVKETNPGLVTRSGYVGLSAPNCQIQSVNDNEMSAKFILVTRQKEANLHNNKVQIVPSKLGKGLVTDNHRGAPIVLFEHGDLPFPIGMSERHGKYLVRTTAKQAIGEVVFSQTLPEASLIFALVSERILRMASIGFLPMKARKMEGMPDQGGGENDDGVIDVFRSVQGGIDFVEALLLEWSIVAVGADQGAFRQLLDRGHLHGQKLTPTFRPFVQKLSGDKPVWTPGADFKTLTGEPDADTPDGGTLIEGLSADEVRQVLNMSVDEQLAEEPAIAEHHSLKTKVNQHFDIESEYLEADRLEYEWVSRFVECQVKHLFNVTSSVPRLCMGSFLTGLRQAAKNYQEVDVRNLSGSKEIPPVYEAVQLNSKLSDDFLIDGLQFMEEKKRGEPNRIVFKFRRTWYGEIVSLYCPRDKKDQAMKILHEAWAWTWQNNFLKGEAFSISGKFMPKGGETFEGLYLKDENKKPLTKIVEQLNEKGKDMRNRGFILMGPPGTGKTLSGRVMLNLSEATFIWVSARDLMYFGGSGGMAYAFDLAADLSPAIIFVEDIDARLTESTIDLIKTEMDGVARSSGTVTCLTTNYPERLPKALIDRPGRFDEVLSFDLPDAATRLAMLTAWLPRVQVTSKRIREVVKRTEGYSGAHLRELCYVAEEEVKESGGTIEQALLDSLNKLEKQRELIDKVHASGGTYDRRYQSAVVLDEAPSAQEEQLQEEVEQALEPLKQQFDHAAFADRIAQGVIKRSSLNSEPERLADRLVARVEQMVEEKFTSNGKAIKDEVGSLIETRSGTVC